MATLKEKLRFSVSNPAIAAAIANDVKVQIAEGKNALTRYKPYIKAVADGLMSPDDARPVMLAVRDKLIKHRLSVHDPRPVAKLQDSRVSEMKSILQLGNWKCWPTVLNYFNDHDMNFDDLKIISKFVRSEVTGEAKKNALAAPAKDRILREIKKRKAQRRGSSNGTTNTTVATVRNPENAVDVIKRQAKGLRKWFGSDKASAERFITAILNAVDNVTAEAKKVMKARKAEAEAEAA